MEKASQEYGAYARYGTVTVIRSRIISADITVLSKNSRAKIMNKAAETGRIIVIAMLNNSGAATGYVLLSPSLSLPVFPKEL